MSTPRPPKTPPPDADEERLDEALDETFPASDAVQPTPREKLPPADAPGSDVRDR
jgi:hypothetical protein